MFKHGGPLPEILGAPFLTPSFPRDEKLKERRLWRISRFVEEKEVTKEVGF
jgi:hypothetical protein